MGNGTVRQQTKVWITEKGINTTIAGITTAAGYQSGVVGMVDVILIVFAAMIVFMMLKSMMEGA
jgi:hypothetical protein